MNIQNLFVPFDIATQLKQLGYVEPCIAYYEVHDMIKGGHRLMYTIHEETNPMKNNPQAINIAAPTYEQTFDWFHSKYNLFTEIFMDDDNTFGFFISHIKPNGRGRLDFPIQRHFQSPQMAKINAIQSLISNHSKFKYKPSKFDQKPMDGVKLQALNKTLKKQLSKKPTKLI